MLNFSDLDKGKLDTKMDKSSIELFIAWHDI